MFGCFRICIVTVSDDNDEEVNDTPPFIVYILVLDVLKKCDVSILEKRLNI